MKVSPSLRNASFETICLLYIVLFVYASVSKLMDFEVFQVQIAQSPLLSSFAGPVSYAVIIIELIISLGLCLQKTRKISLYAAYSLMVLFAGYIVIILNFSPFVPCSCGGILEKLNWNQHLLFNIAFCVLGIVAILFKDGLSSSAKKNTRTFLNLLFLTVGSIGVITGLYLYSEDMFHHRNNFTRRFPIHPAESLYDYPLNVISPYIAGVDQDKIYIGDMWFLAASPQPSFCSSTDAVSCSPSFLTVMFRQPSKGMAAIWAKKLVTGMVFIFWVYVSVRGCSLSHA